MIALLAAIALAPLLAHCAPHVGPRTMAAVIAVESGGSPLAIHDNTSGKSFAPADGGAATGLAEDLIGRGHSVDLGLAQINSANLAGLRLSVRDAFDPCSNLGAAQAILGGSYQRADAAFGPGQYALRRALGAYNTGSLYAGEGYARKVVAAATGPNARFASAPIDRGATPPIRLVRLAPRKRPTSNVLPEDAPILVTLRPVQAPR